MDQKWTKNGPNMYHMVYGRRPPEKSFMCVLHGQPWSGNVLYSYDNEQNPMEIIFTDFQSCSYGRAGQDIAHFLLASTDREFRKNHLETILTAYLTELEDVLNHQGNFYGTCGKFLFGNCKIGRFCQFLGFYPRT